MNLCLRIPWFSQDKPFIALHFCRWGSQYNQSPFIDRYLHRRVYKIGIGIGRITTSFYEASHRDVLWHPRGHWKWWYIDGKWTEQYPR